MKLFLLASIFLLASFQALGNPKDPSLAQFYSSNYYERLGVTSDQSSDEIKKAYRRLMMKYHPDRNPGHEEIAKKINEAYEQISAGHATAPIETGRPTNTSRSDGQTQRPPREATLQALYAYYKKGVFNAADEYRVLLGAFLMGKYDIEAMQKDQQFRDIKEKIFSSPVWKDTSNRLMEAFVSQWGLYSFRYSTEMLVKLFSQLDPANPVLHKVLFNYDFTSPGGDFSSANSRQDYLSLVAAKLLWEEKYRGTPAGEELLNHLYQIWESVKKNKMGPYHAENFAIEILGLLEHPDYGDHRKVIKMAQDIPVLLKKGILGLSGAFDSRYLPFYRKTVKTHPDVFKGLVERMPIDDMIWFYQDLTADERDEQKKFEVAMLKKILTLDEKSFKVLKSDPSFSEVITLCLKSSIWSESDELLKMFNSSQIGYFLKKYNEKLVASWIAEKNPENPIMMRMLLSGSRVDYLSQIIIEMLTYKDYAKTEIAQKLIDQTLLVWRQLTARSYLSLMSTDKDWLLSLAKSMEMPSLRHNPTMKTIYEEIPAFIARGKKGYESQRVMHEEVERAYQRSLERIEWQNAGRLCRQLF